MPIVVDAAGRRRRGRAVASLVAAVCLALGHAPGVQAQDTAASPETEPGTGLLPGIIDDQEARDAAARRAASAQGTRDFDRDGVADELDRCPGTQRDDPVDRFGCTVARSAGWVGVLFGLLVFSGVAVGGVTWWKRRAEQDDKRIGEPDWVVLPVSKDTDKAGIRPAPTPKPPVRPPPRPGGRLYAGPPPYPPGGAPQYPGGQPYPGPYGPPGYPQPWTAQPGYYPQPYAPPYGTPPTHPQQHPQQPTSPPPAESTPSPRAVPPPMGAPAVRPQPSETTPKPVAPPDSTSPVGVPDDDALPEGEAVDAARVRFHRPPEGTLQLLPGRLDVVGGDPTRGVIRFVKIPTEEPEVTFGRAAGPQYRHIQLKIPTVSRMHARMRFLEGVWFIENLSTTNPVVVNGTALRSGDGSRTQLADGDRIEMGEIVFRYWI